MTNYTIPIGLDAITGHIGSLRNQGDGGCNYIIFLDAHNGQTTVTEFICDVFKERRIRHFGGRDAYLEYSLDGTMAQLQQVLTDIRLRACYTNEFEGVIAMDIAGIAKHSHEAQATTFLNAVQALSEHATLVFYLPSAPSHNMITLVNKLRSVLDEVEVFHPAPYTADHLTAIIHRMLDDAGIVMEDTPELYTCILEVVRSAGAVTIKDAEKLTRKLTRCADFTGFRPTLNVQNICACLHADKRNTMKEVI